MTGSHVHLRLVVANLQGTSAEVFEGSYAATRSLAARSDADVLLLQEFREEHLSDIPDALPGWDTSHLVLSATGTTPATRLALVTASRWPVVGWSHRWFVNPRLTRDDPDGGRLASHDKGALHTIVREPSGHELALVNLHALPFALFGVGDTDPIVAQTWQGLGNSAGAAWGAPGLVVVAGDFNLDDRSAPERALQLQGWERLFAGRATRPDGRSTDDIYLSPPFRAVSSSVHDIGSDHFALVAEIAGR